MLSGLLFYCCQSPECVCSLDRLPWHAGTYLVRLTFWYYNYDNKNSPPVFNLTIGEQFA